MFFRVAHVFDGGGSFHVFFSNEKRGIGTSAAYQVVVWSVHMKPLHGETFLMSVKVV